MEAKTVVQVAKKVLTWGATAYLTVKFVKPLVERVVGYIPEPSSRDDF